jgi:hypothetical protein
MAAPSNTTREKQGASADTPGRLTFDFAMIQWQRFLA